MKTLHIVLKVRNLLVAILALVSIQATQAQIFIVDHASGTIDAFNTDGTPIGGGTLVSSLVQPNGIVASGGDLFVATNTGSISEYTFSGTQVGTGALITGLGNPALGLTISGTNLFVSTLNGFPGGGTIGAYTTSGATINSTLITGLSEPVGIATSGSDLFVADGDANTITEYLFDGTQVGAGPLISGLSGPSGLTIVGSNLFVTNYNSGTSNAGTIMEYTLTGTQVGTGPLVSGLTGPTQIASNGSDLFVTFKDSGTVEEFDSTTGALVGSNPLISGLTTPFGIAVVPEPSMWALLALGMSLLGYVQFRRSRTPSK